MSLVDVIAAQDGPISRPTMGDVRALQVELAKLPQFDFQVNHHFSKGVYAREMLMPAGSAAVGKLHATEHLIVIASGEVVIVTDDGTRKIKGPVVMNSLPGIKRAAYAITDCSIITIHVTNERDLAKIEAEVIIPEPDLTLEAIRSSIGLEVAS